MKGNNFEVQVYLLKHNGERSAVPLPEIIIEARNNTHIKRGVYVPASAGEKYWIVVKNHSIHHVAAQGM